MSNSIPVANVTKIALVQETQIELLQEVVPLRMLSQTSMLCTVLCLTREQAEDKSVVDTRQQKLKRFDIMKEIYDIILRLYSASVHLLQVHTLSSVLAPHYKDCPS